MQGQKFDSRGPVRKHVTGPDRIATTTDSGLSAGNSSLANASGLKTNASLSERLNEKTNASGRFKRRAHSRNKQVPRNDTGSASMIMLSDVDSRSHLRQILQQGSTDEIMLFFLSRDIGVSAARQCAKPLGLVCRPEWFEWLQEHTAEIHNSTPIKAPQSPKHDRQSRLPSRASLVRFD